MSPRRRQIQRRYYDPGTQPQPRRFVGVRDPAKVAKESRQIRRAREREEPKRSPSPLPPAA